MAAAILVPCLLSTISFETQRVVLDRADPCVRLLSSEGATGCATPLSGLIAPLHALLDERSLQTMLLAPVTDGDVAIALTASLFRASTLAALQRTLGRQLQAVVVLHADSMPAGAESPEAVSGGWSSVQSSQGELGHAWNSHGGGLSHRRYPFGVALLDEHQSARVVEAAQRSSAMGRGELPP